MSLLSGKYNVENFARLHMFSQAYTVCEQWTVQISLTLARDAVHENALDLACALELLVLACRLSLLSSFGPSTPF